MNCSRVLHSFGSHPQPPAVMPVDLAMYLSLSQRQPLHQLLSMSPLTPAKHRFQPADCPPWTDLCSQRPSSSCSSSSSSLPPSPVPAPPVSRGCRRRDGGGPKRKRVVFADEKGLALTAVRLFISEEPCHTSAQLMKPSPAQLQDQQSTSKRCKLRLGFPEPKLDLKAFVARLQETCIQLESCSVSEHTLSGKVCVSHASVEKVVHIRVTLDSWRSHRDVHCTLLRQQRFGALEMDVFTFEVMLPQNIDPKERIEFYVSFRPGPGSTPYWDNNRGQNYRVLVENDGPTVNQSGASRFYPLLSKHRAPSWPSHMSPGVQSPADLQYLQKGLSSRLRAECKSTCATKHTM